MPTKSPSVFMVEYCTPQDGSAAFTMAGIDAAIATIDVVDNIAVKSIHRNADAGDLRLVYRKGKLEMNQSGWLLQREF